MRPVHGASALACHPGMAPRLMFLGERTNHLTWNWWVAQVRTWAARKLQKLIGIDGELVAKSYSKSCRLLIPFSPYPQVTHGTHEHTRSDSAHPITVAVCVAMMVPDTHSRVADAAVPHETEGKGDWSTAPVFFPANM